MHCFYKPPQILCKIKQDEINKLIHILAQEKKEKKTGIHWRIRKAREPEGLTEQGPRENTGRQGLSWSQEGPGHLSGREGPEARCGGGVGGAGDGARVASEAVTRVLTTADLHHVLIQRKC